MTIAKKELPKSQVELTIEVTIDEFAPFVQKAAKRISERIRIDGFRPGKVPYNTIKQKVGEGAIYEEAADEAVRALFVQAVLREQLNTVGQPEIKVTKCAPGNPFVFTAAAALLPAVTVGEYSRLKTQKEVAIVTEEDIAKTLDELRKMRGKEKLVLREARKGDKAEITFTISHNAVPIEGGTATKLPLELGEGRFVPGFEEQIIGMHAGEEKTFTLTFPTDYFQKTLAGKERDVKLKVDSVYEIELPNVDDELAKSAGDFASLQALKEAIQTNITREREARSTEKFDQSLVEELVSLSTFGDLPDILLQSEVQKMVAELQSDLQSKGVSFTDYLLKLQKTEDALRKDFETGAVKRLRSALALCELVKRENITVDEKELDSEIEKVKTMYRRSEEALKKVSSNEYRNYLGNALVNRKALELLRSKAAQS